MARFRTASIVLAVFIMATACETPQETPTATPAAAEVPTPEVKPEPAPDQKGEKPPSPEPNSTADFDELVRNTPRQQWLDKWGPPTESVSFKMGEGMPEFRVELLNDYPAGAENDDVEIQEDTWNLGTYSFTMWSHKQDGNWVVLQAVSYMARVEF